MGMMTWWEKPVEPKQVTAKLNYKWKLRVYIEEVKTLRVKDVGDIPVSSSWYYDLPNQIYISELYLTEINYGKVSRCFNIE